MPANFSDGLLTLVYKNKGCRVDVANYRPISLLNSDYKILAKVLVNRRKGIVEQIIKSNQAYGVPGRDIADSILTAKAAFKGSEGGGRINLESGFRKSVR